MVAAVFIVWSVGKISLKVSSPINHKSLRAATLTAKKKKINHYSQR